MVLCTLPICCAKLPLYAGARPHPARTVEANVLGCDSGWENTHQPTPRGWAESEGLEAATPSPPAWPILRLHAVQTLITCSRSPHYLYPLSPLQQKGVVAVFGAKWHKRLLVEKRPSLAGLQTHLSTLRWGGMGPQRMTAVDVGVPPSWSLAGLWLYCTQYASPGSSTLRLHNTDLTVSAQWCDRPAEEILQTTNWSLFDTNCHVICT